jgi:hypothetical protein
VHFHILSYCKKAYFVERNNMTDNRLVRLKTYGSELQATLRPEGNSPLEPQKVIDAIGVDLLGQLRLIGISAQNGSPFSYGRTMAADLDEQPLSDTLLALLTTAVNGSVRFFDTDTAPLTAAEEDSHESLVYETATVGFLMLKGFVYEACRLQNDELAATIQLLAAQGELREWLFAALIDGERLLTGAVERDMLVEHSRLPEGMQAAEIIAQIKEKLRANTALQQSS